MDDSVRVTLGAGCELVLSRGAAAGLAQRIRGQLDGTSSVGAAVVLDDDHPLWAQHTGLEGHRVPPEWDSAADLALAQAFYQRIGGKARVLVDLLIDRPGQQLTVDDLCELAPEVFSGSRSVAGSINGLVAAHQASGRRYPFYWWEGRPTRYAMKPSVATLFESARGTTG